MCLAAVASESILHQAKAYIRHFWVLGVKDSLLPRSRVIQIVNLRSSRPCTNKATRDEHNSSLNPHRQANLYESPYLLNQDPYPFQNPRRPYPPTSRSELLTPQNKKTNQRSELPFRTWPKLRPRYIKVSYFIYINPLFSAYSHTQEVQLGHMAFSRVNNLNIEDVLQRCFSYSTRSKTG